MRRAHRSLYRKPQQNCAHRARSDDIEDRGRPALLLPATRHPAGRSGVTHRQWLLQRGAAAAPDGVRRGSAETCQHQFGRQRWLMLEIKDLRVAVDGKEILKGLTLSVGAGQVHAIMGPNGS